MSISKPFKDWQCSSINKSWKSRPTQLKGKMKKCKRKWKSAPFHPGFTPTIRKENSSMKELETGRPSRNNESLRLGYKRRKLGSPSRNRNKKNNLNRPKTWSSWAKAVSASLKGGAESTAPEKDRTKALSTAGTSTPLSSKAKTRLPSGRRWRIQTQAPTLQRVFQETSVAIRLATSTPQSWKLKTTKSSIKTEKSCFHQLSTNARRCWVQEKEIKLLKCCIFRLRTKHASSKWSRTWPTSR